MSKYVAVRNYVDYTSNENYWQQNVLSHVFVTMEQEKHNQESTYKS